jgi:hypothetical protein
MKFIFHEDAEKEFNEAIEYYNSCEENLGFNFAEEIFTSIQRIISFPKAFAKLSKNTRRCLTNKFPFGVIYQIKSDIIYIIAISHLHKKPNYWQKRDGN